MAERGPATDPPPDRPQTRSAKGLRIYFAYTDASGKRIVVKGEDPGRLEKQAGYRERAPTNDLHRMGYGGVAGG
jgi:hypothetical protein